MINMEKIKKIAKYAVNILAIVNALLIGLSPIWDIPNAMLIVETNNVIMGVMGTYLLGQKYVQDVQKGKE